MYLRATVKRTKRGESVRYLQLAHNERNERGVPVARVIHNFGREDQLDREALGRLVRSIQRFLGGEETLRAPAPAHVAASSPPTPWRWRWRCWGSP